jgi:hypothetical protein
MELGCVARKSAFIAALGASSCAARTLVPSDLACASRDEVAETLDELPGDVLLLAPKPATAGGHERSCLAGESDRACLARALRQSRSEFPAFTGYELLATLGGPSVLVGGNESELEHLTPGAIRRLADHHRGRGTAPNTRVRIPRFEGTYPGTGPRRARLWFERGAPWTTHGFVLRASGWRARDRFLDLAEINRSHVLRVNVVPLQSVVEGRDPSLADWYFGAVGCRDGAPVDADPRPAGRGWYCFDSAGRYAECHRTLPACSDARAAALLDEYARRHHALEQARRRSAGGNSPEEVAVMAARPPEPLLSMGDCKVRSKASCFIFVGGTEALVHTPLPHVYHVCYSTNENCERERFIIRADTSKSDQCTNWD